MIKKIAITQPDGDKYSQTFIRSHIARLSQYAEVHNLHSGWIPTHANGKALIPAFLIFIEKVLCFLFEVQFVRLFAAWRIERYLAENKIDFVLCEFGPGGVAMAPICKKLNIPFAVHFFGLDLHGTEYRERYGSAYSNFGADLVVAISSLQEKTLSAMGLHSVKHIACGAEPHFFRPVVREWQSLFVACGRMIEKKGPLYTLKAFKIVADGHDAARLVMVGDGPLLPELKQYVSDNDLAGKVTFVGVLSPVALADLFGTAAAFVQHSITASNGDSEGTPITVLEAGLAGLPVISTRHAGINDVVIHETTGYLVPEMDIYAMAFYMEKLITTPGLNIHLGVAAQRHILQNYTTNQTIPQLWAAIDNAYTSHYSTSIQHETFK